MIRKSVDKALLEYNTKILSRLTSKKMVYISVHRSLEQLLCISHAIHHFSTLNKESSSTQASFHNSHSFTHNSTEHLQPNITVKMDTGPQSSNLDGYRAYREAQNPWLQAKLDILQNKKSRQYNPNIIAEFYKLETPLPRGAAHKKVAEKAEKRPSNFELFSTARFTQTSNIRSAPIGQKYTTAQRSTEKKRPSIPVLPVVEDFDAPFLSPGLDTIRSFRTHPYPWATTAVSNEAMALRDQKFKLYNARHEEPVLPWEPHFLDHNTEASKSGTFQRHTVTVEERRFKAQLFDEQKNELNNATWVFGYVLAAAGLYWGAGVIRFVSAFLFRESLAPVLLFSSFLLWLII